MAIKTDNLINSSGSLSVPIDTVVQGSAKAWINFNGTGTVAIRASFNVSSITDNGVGDYTVNFTSAMVDANYSVSGSCLGGGAGAWYNLFGGKNTTTSNTRNTSNVQITSAYVSSTSGASILSDFPDISVTINR